MIDEDGPFIARVTAPAPASASDPLFVTIRSFDGDRAPHGPCLWEPPAGALPAVGDVCVVVRALEEDGEGEQTIVVAFDRDESSATEADVSAAAAAAAAAVTAHEADQTAVHGIANTADLVTSPGGDRIIRGVVSGAGSIVEGSGFTVSRVSAGVYDVAFTTAFADVPSIETQVSGPSFLFSRLANSVPPTASGFRIVFVSTALAALDTEFHFTAVGP